MKNLLQSRVFMKVFVVTQMFPESGTPIQLVKDCFTRAQDAQAGFGVQKSGHRFQIIRTQFREIGHFLLIPPFFQLQFLVVRWAITCRSFFRLEIHIFFLKKSRFFFIHQNSLKKKMAKKSLKWSSKNVNKVSPIFSNSNFLNFTWFLRFRKIFHKNRQNDVDLTLNSRNVNKVSRFFFNFQF